VSEGEGGMMQVHAAMGLYIVVMGDGGAEVVGRLVAILLLSLLLLVTLVTVHRVAMMGPIVGLKSTEKEIEGQVLEKGGRRGSGKGGASGGESLLEMKDPPENVPLFWDYQLRLLAT